MQIRSYGPVMLLSLLYLWRCCLVLLPLVVSSFPWPALKSITRRDTRTRGACECIRDPLHKPVTLVAEEQPEGDATEHAEFILCAHVSSTCAVDPAMQPGAHIQHHRAFSLPRQHHQKYVIFLLQAMLGDTCENELQKEKKRIDSIVVARLLR